MRSRGPVGGNIHAGALARAMVDSPPLTPDQSSLPGRRRSVAARGEISIY